MNGTSIQVLGIDPGKKGALVWIGSDGQPFKVFPTPLRGGQIDFLRMEALVRSLNTTAKFEVAIEKQQPFRHVKSSTQVVMNYGVYLDVLKRVGIRFTEYHPSTWKAAFKLLGQRKRRGQLPLPGEAVGFSARNKVNKAASFDLASMYWPQARARFGKAWTADAAEAALIGQLHRINIIRRETT